MSATINESLVAFLIDGANVQGICAVYDEQKFKQGLETPTFYKAPGDLNIEVGDIVNVPCSAGHRLQFTTNKVVEVNVQPDFNDKATIKWIAGVTKTKNYDECVAFEKTVMDKFREAERERIAAEQRETINAVMGDMMKDLPALPGS